MFLNGIAVSSSSLQLLILQLLVNAVKKYGCKDWWKIKLEVPGRTDNSCRDRCANTFLKQLKSYESEQILCLFDSFNCSVKKNAFFTQYPQISG